MECIANGNNQFHMWMGIWVALCQRQGPIAKALFAMCNGVWPPIPDNVLDGYVEEGGDDVVSSQQQASCFAPLKVHGSQTAPSSPHRQCQGRRCFEWTPKPHKSFRRQMCLKEGIKIPRNASWIRNGPMPFTRLIFPLVLSGIVCSSRP